MDRSIQGTITGSVIVAVPLHVDRMEPVRLEREAGWLFASCPVLAGESTNLWRALDVMLLCVLGAWLHARVLWCGLHDLLRTTSDTLPNMWKRKALLTNLNVSNGCPVRGSLMPPLTLCRCPDQTLGSQRRSGVNVGETGREGKVLPGRHHAAAHRFRGGRVGVGDCSKLAQTVWGELLLLRGFFLQWLAVLPCEFCARLMPDGWADAAPCRGMSSCVSHAG